MKHVNKHILVFLAAMLLSSCKEKDAAIKADLTAKARDQMEYAGVRFTVADGVVNLSGACATEQMRDRLIGQIRKVYGVKRVSGNIVIAPVIVGTDWQLKLGVDSILANYPGVQALVRDSVVALEGRLEPEQWPKLLAAIQSLQPRGLVSRLAAR
jgi:hypothetical protein